MEESMIEHIVRCSTARTVDSANRHAKIIYFWGKIDQFFFLGVGHDVLFSFYHSKR